MKLVIAATQAALFAIYLAAAASLFTPALSWARQPLLWITAALFAIHFVEYLFVKNRLQGSGSDQTDALLGNLLFGFAYWWPRMKETSESNDA